MNIAVQRQQGDCYIDVRIHSANQGITALIGPSGAGKSTLINMVAGLVRPDAGVISVQGHCLFDHAKGINLPPEHRRIGYVFQEGRLFPHLSVQANLLYGQHRQDAYPLLDSPHNSSLSPAPISLPHVCQLLGIEALLHRKPRTLSGGEKQRVAFGRAVLSRPRLLLMDEPLASLDLTRKQELLPFIQQLNAQFGIPILYVSHSDEEIRALTDTVISMCDGKIQ